MNVALVSEDGSRVADVELLDVIFAAKVNVPLMHQVVTAQLAAARSGTHSTKTRAEARGGGRKPWRQKGTGRARHGSIREPQWVGGGVAFGPKPRDHSKGVNKKMKAVALRSALSARAKDEKIVVVEDLGFDAPKTRRAMKALEAWSAGMPVLLVLSSGDAVAAYSFRNIPKTHIITQDQLNTYDVLNADTVVFTRSALDSFQQRASALPGRRSSEPDAAVPASVGAATPSEPDATSPPAEDAAAVPTSVEQTGTAAPADALAPEPPEAGGEVRP